MLFLARPEIPRSAIYAGTTQKECETRRGLRMRERLSLPRLICTGNSVNFTDTVVVRIARKSCGVDSLPQTRDGDFAEHRLDALTTEILRSNGGNLVREADSERERDTMTVIRRELL